MIDRRDDEDWSPILGELYSKTRRARRAKQIAFFLENSRCDVVSLPAGFGLADAEALDFFALWDNGADADTLIGVFCKMSPLAAAIVGARFKHRDFLEAKYSKY